MLTISLRVCGLGNWVIDRVAEDGIRKVGAENKRVWSYVTAIVDHPVHTPLSSCTEPPCTKPWGWKRHGIPYHPQAQIFSTKEQDHENLEETSASSHIALEQRKSGSCRSSCHSCGVSFEQHARAGNHIKPWSRRRRRKSWELFATAMFEAKALRTWWLLAHVFVISVLLVYR